MTRWIVGGGLLAVLAVASTGLAVQETWQTPLAWIGRAFGARRDDAAPRPETARVERRDLSAVVKATGVVRPALGSEVRVAFRNPGIVSRLHVAVGDRVRKGQILAQLEARELKAQRDRAAAALKSAEIAREYAEKEYARTQLLVSREAASPRDLDRAEEGVAASEAGVEVARASLSAQRATLEGSSVYAPISGTVSWIATQEGEATAAPLGGTGAEASPLLLTIVDLDQLQVWAYVDETDIGTIEIGQEARFTVDAYPGQEFSSRVAAVYPKAEIRDNVVNYIVVLTITAPPPSPPGKTGEAAKETEPKSTVTLRPEMTATVQIVHEAHARALTIPRRALRRERGQSFVFVQEGQGLVRRPVETGSRDESAWEIVRGLAEGDQVVVGELPEPPTH